MISDFQPWSRGTSIKDWKIILMITRIRKHTRFVFVYFFRLSSSVCFSSRGFLDLFKISSGHLKWLKRKRKNTQHSSKEPKASCLFWNSMLLCTVLKMCSQARSLLQSSAPVRCSCSPESSSSRRTTDPCSTSVFWYMHQVSDVYWPVSENVLWRLRWLCWGVVLSCPRACDPSDLLSAWWYALCSSHWTWTHTDSKF